VLKTLAPPAAIICAIDYPELFTVEELKQQFARMPETTLAALANSGYHHVREYIVDRRRLSAPVKVVRRRTAARPGSTSPRNDSFAGKLLTLEPSRVSDRRHQPEGRPMTQNAAPQFSNRRKSLGHAQARDPDALPQLDGDMTCDLLTWTLQRLPFRHGVVTLEMDRHVRDYLVNALRRR
jgi:hypothetical protein